MKRYLTLSLGLLLILGLQACSQSNVPVPNVAQSEKNQQLLLQQWRDFCDGLKAMGEDIISADTGHTIDTAEGFRYLAMLAGLAIEKSQGYDDPRYPDLHRVLDLHKKQGLDSSDNLYRMLTLDSAGHYRISGYRSNSTYLGFQVNEGNGAVANLNDRDMTVEEDGYFELHLSQQRPQGELNWLQLPAGADNMYIREIFIDWEKEQTSRLWVERLDIAEPPRPLTAEQVGLQLSSALEQANTWAGRWTKMVAGIRLISTNDLVEPKATGSEGGTPDNLYSGGYFALADDEALIIEVEPVDALFWSIQLGNVWFQSLDYQYRQTSLNQRQVIPDEDGKIRFVIAHEDSGAANWLDTSGHNEGLMFLRWNQPVSAPAKPEVKKVKLEQLWSHLPKGSVQIDTEQRRRQLQSRRGQVARRFGL